MTVIDVCQNARAPSGSGNWFVITLSLAKIKDTVPEVVVDQRSERATLFLI